MAMEIKVRTVVPRIIPAAERQSRFQTNKIKKRPGNNLRDAATDSNNPEVSRRPEQDK